MRLRQSLAAAADSFGPKDTIDACVATTGVEKGHALKAKWPFTDEKAKVIPVNEKSRAATG